MLVRIIICIFIFTMAEAAVISSTVGQVSGQVVTSREALQSLYVEKILFEGKAIPTDINSKVFARRLNGVLLEMVVYLEALEFRPKVVTDKQLRSKAAIIKTRLKSDKNWRSLETSNEELRSLIKKKLIAKDFVQFKANSSVVPITDQEARSYFKDNKAKFGGASFDSLQENIKGFLNRRQVDIRLKSWFDILKSKYRVKNLVQ